MSPKQRRKIQRGIRRSAAPSRQSNHRRMRNAGERGMDEFYRRSPVTIRLTLELGVSRTRGADWPTRLEFVESLQKRFRRKRTANSGATESWPAPRRTADCPDNRAPTQRAACARSDGPCRVAQLSPATSARRARGTAPYRRRGEAAGFLVPYRSARRPAAASSA